ncbi:MAG: hypothetical protein MI924_20675 [Chloroflexales bacterium]|nr:hypothetical protein [Chloroflexales bacterium]
MQSWMASLIKDEEITTFAGNELSIVTAVASVYPGVADLLKEMQRSLDATVALIANLPAKLVSRKGSYISLGTTMLPLAEHHLPVHFRQIENTLEAARQARTVG